MNLVPHTITPAISSVFATVPALVAAASERAGMRFLEFFAANIRNPHTRRSYARAAEEFLAWCASVGVLSIAAVQPVHVAAWIEAATRELAAPSAKQRFATIRRLFDWLDHRPGRAGQSGARGARAAPRRHDRTNAGTRSRRSARAARQQRPVEAGGPNAYAMIRRRAAAAGIATKLGNHSFRATGITAYLKNGGTLEKAAAMANHASTLTTQLYDSPARRGEPR
jgi:site-specific recombinase XerD